MPDRGSGTVSRELNRIRLESVVHVFHPQFVVVGTHVGNL